MKDGQGNSPVEHESLDPLLVQVLREQGEALAPDAASRARVWKRVEQGMAVSGAPDWLRWIRGAWRSPRRWVPAIVFVSVVAIGVPMIMESADEPDWNAVEFKGGVTVRLARESRMDFVAGLRRRGVSFEESPIPDIQALRIRPDQQGKLDPAFRQTWNLPLAHKAPLFVIFE